MAGERYLRHLTSSFLLPDLFLHFFLIDLPSSSLARQEVVVGFSDDDDDCEEISNTMDRHYGQPVVV